MQVVRQTEPELITAVNELCNGETTEKTDSFMRGLCRPLPPESDPVMLFGTNFDVDFFNGTLLAEAPGELYRFEATDTGKSGIIPTSKNVSI